MKQRLPRRREVLFLGLEQSTRKETKNVPRHRHSKRRRLGRSAPGLACLRSNGSTRRQRGQACAKGSVSARIAGRHACLRAGQRCRSALNRQYQRYGFHCRNGRLQRRKPPLPAAGKIAASIRFPLGSAPMGVVYANGAVWVSEHHSAVVARIDPATNKIVARVSTPTGEPGRLAA